MTAESLDDLVARLQKRAQQLYDGWKVRTDDTIAAIANELSESAEQIVALRARAEEWQTVAEGCLGAAKIADSNREIAETLHKSERDALAIEVLALRTALREELISQPRKDVIKSGRCWLCRGEY